MSERDPFDFSGDSRAGAARQPAPPGASPQPAPPGAVHDVTPAAAAVPVRIPLRWLGLGITTAVIAAVLALLYGTVVPVAFVCWVLAGPVSIGLLALHILRATAIRAGPTAYTEPGAAALLYWTTVAVAAAGIVLSAWQIADWAGRL